MHFKKINFYRKVDALKIVKKLEHQLIVTPLEDYEIIFKVFSKFKSISPLVCFSVKSNSNLQIQKN